jgi:hypothetical protein
MGTARHSVALHFWQTHAQKECPMGQLDIVRVLTLIGLKAKQIDIELLTVYGDEALQISAVKK